MKYVCYSDDVWHASEIDILYNSHLGKSISNKQSSFLDRGAKLIQIWMRYANHLCIKHRKSNTAWNVSCHVKSTNDQKSWNHLTVNWFNICPNKYSLVRTCYFTNVLSSIIILLPLTKISFFICRINLKYYSRNREPTWNYLSSLIKRLRINSIKEIKFTQRFVSPPKYLYILYFLHL